MSEIVGEESVRVRAAHLLDLHRPQEAARVLSGWLAQNPDDGDALCLAARAALALDDAARAADLAGHAASVEPDQEWPLRLLALARSQQGRHEEALTAATSAIALAPGVWQGHHVMAHVCIDAPGRAVQAWDAARRATALAPHESDTHTVMGTVALNAGDTVTAEKALTEALRLEPSNAVALNELGRLHLARKDHVGAALQFASAARNNVRLDVATHNVDVALTAAVARVFVGAWAILFVPARFAILLPGQEAIVAGLVTLGCLAVLLVWQGRLLRPLLRGSLRRYVMALPSRDRQLTAIAALTALGILGLAVMCVIPVAARWPAALVGAAALVACRIILAVRSRRLRTKT